MAACVSPYCLVLDTRNPMGMLTVLGGRVSVGSYLGRIGSLKMSDEKNRFLGAGQKSYSPQFMCYANSHSVGSYHNKDPFLNLHPEVSMLRGEANSTLTTPRKAMKLKCSQPHDREFHERCRVLDCQHRCSGYEAVSCLSRESLANWTRVD